MYVDINCTTIFDDKKVNYHGEKLSRNILKTFIKDLFAMFTTAQRIQDVLYALNLLKFYLMIEPWFI